MPRKLTFGLVSSDLQAQLPTDTTTSSTSLHNSISICPNSPIATEATRFLHILQHCSLNPYYHHGPLGKRSTNFAHRPRVRHTQHKSKSSANPYIGPADETLDTIEHTLPECLPLRRRRWHPWPGRLERLHLLHTPHPSHNLVTLCVSRSTIHVTGKDDTRRREEFRKADRGHADVLPESNWILDGRIVGWCERVCVDVDVVLWAC